MEVRHTTNLNRMRFGVWLLSGNLFSTASEEETLKYQERKPNRKMSGKETSHILISFHNLSLYNIWFIATSINGMEKIKA
jgi:hypothetical protein